MIMKKLFMLLPIAALLLASCSTDEQQFVNSDPRRPNIPTDAIWFTSGINDMTRGLTTMSNFASFNVTGLHTDAEYSFSDLNVTSADNGATWTYNTGSVEKPYKLFPGDNSNISFYAYAPTTLYSETPSDNHVSITSEGQAINAFTQAQHVVDHTDVLAAFATGNKINNTMSGVTLDFKHALAQIEIHAKNSDADKYQVEVLGVKLCRTKKTGNMAFQTTATGYPTWASLTTPQDFIKKGSTPITLTADAQNIMFNVDADNPDNFLMVPQQLTAWTGVNTDADGAYLSVLCRIKSKKDEAWVQRFPDEVDKYGFAAVPIGTKWLPGHKYVYTLDFFGDGGGAGLVDPRPTNPDTAAGGSSDPSDPADDDTIDPTPTPMDEDGTEVDGGDTGGTAIIPEATSNIKFTVNITNWITGEGDTETLAF
jgi:hypothetical protein